MTVTSLHPSSRQTHQAGELSKELSRQVDEATVTLQVPRELAQLLRDLMPRLANRESISFVSVPEDLTTSAAAEMLGMSRPTLMKLVREDKIPSHKIGTHTRLRATDVRAYREQLIGQRRQAYEELLELDEQAGITE